MIQTVEAVVAATGEVPGEAAMLAETACDGLVSRSDRGEQFEWEMTEDDLRRVALSLHRLACNPAHEYDRLLVADKSVAGVQVRMTDAAEWLQ